MADVRPFCGLRYNPKRVSDFSSVISPPYDIISQREQAIYYSKNPYNIIRLEFSKEHPDDTQENNRYVRAAATMNNWLRDHILIQEDCPAFYLIEHRFPYQDAMKSWWGVIARVRLEDLSSGQIRPHEKTMKEPAEDRFLLLQSCRANLSPVIGMFHSEQGDILPLLMGIDTNKPSLSASGHYGTAYNIWTVTDKETTQKVSDFFVDKILYIADGHHRYKTALRYQKEQVANCSHCSGNEAFNFVMMTLVNSEDTGLVMFPFHRLLRGIESEKLEQLPEKLGDYFNKELIPPSSVKNWLALLEARYGKMIFGLYGLHGRYLCLLTPRKDMVLQEMMPKDKPSSLKELDVSLLHELVLQRMLNIDNS
jgi:uncharacterized protein (DUF1015 family)